MAAEFEHYRPLAYWDMHEATCLLLGKDPRRLKSIVVFHREGRESSIALSDFPHRSPFAARFRDLANVLKRAAETGVIGDEDRIDPSRLIPWALTRGISVPKALVTAFPQPDAGARQELDDGEIESSTAAPPSSSPDMSTAVPRANLEREVSRLKAQLKTEKPPTLSGEKPRCCCSKDCSMELSEATHGKSLPASRMSSILSTRLLAGASTQILSGRA
jgi:hypothetical protein